MNRRTLFKLSFALPFAASGCNVFKGQNVATVTTEIVSDLESLATEFVTALPALTSANVLSASAAATITNDVSVFNATAKQVTATLSATAALPIVQQLLQDFNGMVLIASGLAPPPFGTVLAAAAVLLPFVENSILALINNQPTPSPVAPPPPATFRMRAPAPVRGVPVIITPQDAIDALNHLKALREAR